MSLNFQSGIEILISNSLLPVVACCDSRCPFVKYLLHKDQNFLFQHGGSPLISLLGSNQITEVQSLSDTKKGRRNILSRLNKLPSHRGPNKVKSQQKKTTQQRADLTPLKTDELAPKTFTASYKTRSSEDLNFFSSLSSTRFSFDVVQM